MHETLGLMVHKSANKQEIEQEGRGKERTKVSSFVGGLGLLDDIVEVLLQLLLPLHELGGEDDADAHPQHVLPWICIEETKTPIE